MDQRTGSNTQTLEITIYGMVQGIGFRPFLVQLAASYQVTGTVANKGGFVALIVTGERKALEAFAVAIKEQAPSQAAIVHMQIRELPWIPFERFEITQSEEGDSPWVMLPADLPVCEECLRELSTPENLRYQHPLISCMRCGPRYSIIRNIPYDRETTTMDDFQMCEVCQKEYEERTNRRYYAQTISCHACGPYLRYRDRNKGEKEREAALAAAIRDLKAGRCIAIKGIGGYHLACSPFDEVAVTKLRRLKKREAKPFAVMFGSMAQLRVYCEVNTREEKLLHGSGRPIVLLKRRGEVDFADGVCGFSSEVGAFLPYTAIQHMILQEIGPLVMTSVNRSGEPILSKEEEIIPWLEEGLAGMLYHDRQIVAKLDDSVARVLSNGKTQLIRRSRGYVPTPLYVGEGMPGLLGVGGQLKGSFCLGAGEFAYPSEYFGDLDDGTTWAWYRERLMILPKLIRFQFDTVVCDQHPQYRTSGLAKTLGKKVIAVQHHHAHIGSVMAEHQLRRVIGVCFDGTGYGTDGTIWGGEFLICEEGCMNRAAHLSLVTLLGGDESMKDAAKTASCYLVALGHEGIDQCHEVIERAIAHQINTFTCSSMGRLFDGVASLLGLGDYNHFEGECAMRLEEAAKMAHVSGEGATPLRFEIQYTASGWILDAYSLLRQLLAAKEQGESRERLALGFHLAIVEAVKQVVGHLGEAYGMRDVALSGGVFQNRLLLENCLEQLEGEGYHCYINEKVPPHDGGIALGQVYVGGYKIREEAHRCV